MGRSRRERFASLRDDDVPSGGSASLRFENGSSSARDSFPLSSMRRGKLSNIWPPVVALAVVGMGIGMQHREMAEFELRAKALRSRAERDVRPAVPEKDSSVSVIDGRRIDWGKLLVMNGDGQSQAFNHVWRLLFDLSPEELLASLDQLAAVDVPTEKKKEWEDLLLQMLGRRDPRRVFDRFSAEVGIVRSPRSSLLHQVFARWSEQDSRAAAAWLDAQVAAGIFESKSINGLHSRLVDFESDLVRAWVNTDPASATARVSTLPEPLRSAVLKEDLLEQYRRPEDAKAIANLIRQVAGEAQAPQALADSSNMFTLMVLENREAYESLGRLFKDIEATPEERNTVALSALSYRLLNQPKWVEREDAAACVDEMRTWALSEAPGAAGSITGNALGQLAMKRFDEAAKLAIQYQEAGSDDSVLVTFLSLKELAQSHPAEALPLLERISDPTKREEIRKLFPMQP